MGYEALAAGGRSLLALFEANGANVNPTPSAARLDPENLRIEDRPSMPAIEYRLTDATDMDGNGVFFVTNYFWPGERDVLDPAEDKLNSSLLRGSLNRAVERIVPLRYDGEKLEVAGEPINLKRERDSRNWEGIARLDDRGFLIATDKFPRTILGFVEKPAR
jgi:hypothetical protein